MQLSELIATGRIYTLLDTIMCMLWIGTYTLVLIGTIQYQYPLISPITQAIIAPFEFSVVFLYIKIGAFGFNYGSAAYLYWTLIEIAIFVVILKLGHIKRKYLIPYIGLVVGITAIMVYFVTLKEQMFFFSYFNTFIGIAFWFQYILNEKYPLKPIALAAFISKFFADLVAVVVYIDNGFWATKLMCVLLPVLDLLFIIVYLKRRKEKQ